MVRCDCSANLPVLAGTQNIPRIRKQPGQLNCPSVLRYLAVRKGKLSLMRIDGAIGENQLEVQPVHRRVSSLEVEIFPLTHVEVYLNRIKPRTRKHALPFLPLQIP